MFEIKNKKDFATGIIFCGISLFFLINIFNATTISTILFNSIFFLPLVFSLILIGLGIILIIKSLWII